MGALVGSGSETTARHFGEYGLNLGLAFQIRDDILGIWGDPQVTGKSAATDILSRKKSLPVLFGLQHSSRLAALYAQEQFGDNEVQETVSLLNDAGALEYAQQQETHHYRAALDALERAEPKNEAAAALVQLTESLFQRQA